jgi:hypothetical protein
MPRTPVIAGESAQMIAWCPAGALYHPIHQLCMTNQYALGPFSEKMKQDCEKFRGPQSQECAEENWDIFFAGVLRGAARCPAGSEFNAQLKACVNDDYGYGPFTEEQVRDCKSLQWAYTCETMKWPIAVLRGQKAPPADVPIISDQLSLRQNLANLKGFSAKLLAYYSNPSNYRKTYAQVMDWFGTTRNACVAFMTTAMRNAGLPVPRALNSKGYNISTWTAALSEYLEESLGWQRITRLKDLSAGDIVFTLDLDGSTRVPAHVFLFAEWIDDQSTRARVIDNQGFLHVRDLQGTQGNFTPFNYALRPKN